MTNYNERAGRRPRFSDFDGWVRPGRGSSPNGSAIRDDMLGNGTVLSAKHRREIAMTPRIPALVGLAFGFLPAITSANERPVGVELFTSQGCSSCTRANTFLNERSKRRSDILPLAFHDTYGIGSAGKTHVPLKPRRAAKQIRPSIW
jgi:hypothetical protein